MGRSSMGAAIFLAGLTAADAAAAQTHASDADYDRAGALRTGMHLADALASYQHLYEQTREPRALAQAGVTEAQMGRWVLAEEHLTAALATSDRWVLHHREDLQRALEQVRLHVGSLSVTANVAGAEIRINDTSMGRLPRPPVRVALGAVVVDLVADGYEPHRETVQVTGQSTQLELTLVRRTTPTATAVAPPPEVARTPEVAATPARTPATTSVRVNVVTSREPPGGVERPATREPSGSTLPRTMAWVGVGTATAFAGLGIASFVVGSGAAATWNDDAQCLRPGMTREQVCSEQQATTATMGTLATVGFVGAGLFAATSLVLFLAGGGPRQEPTGDRAALACGMGPGTIGLACGGLF